MLKSKIVDYLIYQFNKNGFDRINSIKMLKKVKLTDNIYESFNLTEEEIKIIENNKNYSKTEIENTQSDDNKYESSSSTNVSEAQYKKKKIVDDRYRRRYR